MAEKLKIPNSVRVAFGEAKKVRKLAYAPYSNFKVGSALLSETGAIDTGCNVENASYGATLCAERVAIFKAVSRRERKFVDIVVVTDAAKPAFPCAFCLQVMAEFFSPDTRIWVANTKSIQSMHLFSELLPKPFGPRQLKEAGK
jgi:cytidine deaminase